MEEKSLTDLLAQFFPGDSGDQPNKPGEQNPVLAESLKALAGQTSEPLRLEVTHFLNGEGELHTATRSATTSGSGNGLNDIISMLASQFKLSPAIAKIIASLLVKLMPAAKKDDSAEKPAAAKKKMRKTTSSTKLKPAAARKKPSAKPKPKPATAKPAAKKTTSKPKPKTTKRSVEADIEGI